MSVFCALLVSSQEFVVSHVYNADSDQTAQSESLLEEYATPLLCHARAKMEVCFNFDAPTLTL